jgi:hypothetical protein
VPAQSHYISLLYETLRDARTGLQSKIGFDIAQADVSTSPEISDWFAINVIKGRRKEGVEQRVAMIDFDINR